MYYYVTVTNAGCSTTSNTAAVIVSPALEISSPASSSVCINEPATTLQVTVTNGVDQGSYQWYVNTNLTNTGGTEIVGATAASYVAPTAVVGTKYYYAVATFPGQVCPVISSSPATVTVTQTPDLSGGNQTIYSGNAFNFIPGEDPSDVLPTGTTYSWPTPTVSNAGIIGANAASGVSNISQNLVNNSTENVTVTYTITPTNGFCDGIPFNYEVIVTPLMQSNSTVTNATCFDTNDGAITINISGGTPPYTIEWDGPLNFSQTSTTITDLAAGTYILTMLDNAGNIESEQITITKPTLTPITSSEQTVCINETPGALEVNYTGSSASSNLSMVFKCYRCKYWRTTNS